MLSKRSSYLEKQGNAMPSEKRFRANVADLFLSNDISGNRVLELVKDHASSDQSCVNDLLTVGSSGRHKNNVSRDLLRKLKKGTAWPALYWAKIRLFDLKMQKVRKRWMPFHEVLWCLNMVGFASNP